VRGWAIEDLVVEVLARTAGTQAARWSVGSGFVVGAGRVLTAAHNLGSGELLVRFRGAEERPATVADLGGGQGRAVDLELDLAVLELASGGGGEARAGFARVAASPSLYAPNIGGCRAIGFPRFRERAREAGKPPLRDTARLDGYVPVGQGLVSGRLTFQVETSPRPLPSRRLEESEWEGMSGAAVLAGRHVIGVISEHNPAEGPSALTVASISALDQLAASERWYRVLGIADPLSLPVLPQAPARWERERTLERALQAEFEQRLADPDRLPALLKATGAEVKFVDKMLKQKHVERLLWSLDQLGEASRHPGAAGPRGSVADVLHEILRGTRGVADSPATGRVQAACHVGLYAVALVEHDLRNAGTELLHAFRSEPEVATKLFPAVTKAAFKGRWRDIDEECRLEAKKIKAEPYLVRRTGAAGAAVGLGVLGLVARTPSVLGPLANMARQTDRAAIEADKLSALQKRCDQRRMERVRELAAAALGVGASAGEA
jgi:hypothetical protein